MAGTSVSGSRRRCARLAATPERAAEIDSNEGVLDVIEVKFPSEGQFDHPAFRQADRHALLSDAALARCVRRLPFEGDRRRYAGGSRDHPHLGFVRAARRRTTSSCSAKCLGGGGPGRPWADGSDVVHVVPNSRNLPAEFAETRYPVLVEQFGLKQDSGGAGYPPRRLRLRQADPRARVKRD